MTTNDLPHTQLAGDGANPIWLRDETILALDLYMRRRDHLPYDNSPEVVELSDLLRLLHEELGTKGAATLRNRAGVAMKLQNFKRLDPQVLARGQKGLPRGARLEREVWDEFVNDPARLGRVAAAIKREIQAKDGGPKDETDISDDEEGAEGHLLTRLHRSRERNHKIVARKKEQALKKHGHLSCEVCTFNFQDRYGAHGAGFIECHHTKPVETLDAGSTTKLADLALLCANCHRMIHARRRCLSLDQLRALLVA